MCSPDAYSAYRHVGSQSSAPTHDEDDINFLDRNAVKILIWAVAISFALRLISYWLTPSREQLKDKTVEELDGEMVVWGVVGVLIGLLAGLVGVVGKVLALIGFVLRGRDRERRRRGEHASRQSRSSVCQSQDMTDR